MHIGSINYVSFYSSIFINTEEAHNFLKIVEESKTKAKIVIHQAARMLWLADRIDEVAYGRPALQILFYMIAAEAISKIVFNYNGNNNSRKYSLKFFSDICSVEHKKILSQAFIKDGIHLNFEDSIKLLYKIRCDVVHEGKYYDFYFNNTKEYSSVISSWKNPALRVCLSLQEIRKIILEGAVIAAKQIIFNNFPMNI